VEKVREGDRFVTTRDTPVRGVTHWRAPFTGGFSATLPEGTVLVADIDGVEGAEAFCCRPERYEAVEAELVPEEERLAGKYDGYSLVLLYSDVGVLLRRI
jgi:hypothetical protein